MKARLPLLLLGVSALSLGACATQPRMQESVPTQADLHHISVEQTGSRMDISVAPGDTMLTDKARADIADFAGAYMRIGHGAMIMSTPSGSGNADSAGLMAQQARLELVNAGVPYSAVAGSTYDASGAAGAPIILSFTRFEAHAPECAPLWTQDLAHQSDNRPWPSFGCATQANIAAMVEDPHDLLEPRAEDPRDSGRRATVMEAYRAGHRTAAERTEDDRVTISTVAH